jgi:1-acyl-sn-glycerol-3-phosphate acyltransferase
MKPTRHSKPLFDLTPTLKKSKVASMKLPLFSKVRAFFFVSIFIPLTGLCAVSAIIATFFDKSGRLYHWHAQLWSRVSLLVGGIRLSVEGVEHIPAGPMIIMSNHQGAFDILSLMSAIPVPIAWMAKKELFSVPLFGHSMRRAGYIPLDREHGRKALRGITEAAELIRNGRSVIIFPEGTRSTDSHLLPFKKGGFVLAAKAGVPIVPTVIEGTLAIQPPKTFSLTPGTVRIRFMPPVATAGKSADTIMDEIRSIIATELGQ